MQTYEKSQKGQEVVESKPTSTMLNKVKTTEKSQKGEDEFTTELSKLSTTMKVTCFSYTDLEVQEKHSYVEHWQVH